MKIFEVDPSFLTPLLQFPISYPFYLFIFFIFFNFRQLNNIKPSFLPPWIFWSMSAGIPGQTAADFVNIVILKRSERLSRSAANIARRF